MIDKIKGMWEWIAAVGVALVSIFAYGWYRERQGRQKGKAKAKVEKAKRERRRANEKIEEAGEKVRSGNRTERKAARRSEILRTRARRRLEEAAIEMGKSAAEAREMSDEEITEAVGG